MRSVKPGNHLKGNVFWGGERDDVDDGNDTNIRDLYYFNTAKSLLTE